MWDMKPGMQIICIEDDWNNNFQLTHPVGACPIKGLIYTIREIEPILGGIGLRFEEIQSNLSINGKEYAFISSSFRPVKPTDISMLKVFLNAPQPPAVPQKVLEILHRG